MGRGGTLMKYRDRKKGGNEMRWGMGREGGERGER